MSHPDPNAPLDRRPIEIGEVWENPMTGERATVLELPHQNGERRLVAELVARAGAQVVGEHRHPGITEHFTVIEGELLFKLDGHARVLRRGQTALIPPNAWHDWWNESGHDTHVRVELAPGERFLHMIETFFGLAQLGHTNQHGMPSLLQLSLTGREFRDVIEFRSPHPAVQRVILGTLAPIARWRGYSGTYPQLSRSLARQGPSPVLPLQASVPTLTLGTG